MNKDLKSKNNEKLELEEKLKTLTEENLYLKESVCKLTRGKTSLALCLKGSKSGNNKQGLGYIPLEKGKQAVIPGKYPLPKFVKETKLPQKMAPVKENVLKSYVLNRHHKNNKNYKIDYIHCCSHCNKLGHTVNTCTTRHLVWIPKGYFHASNHQGPKKIWVPTSE